MTPLFSRVVFVVSIAGCFVADIMVALAAKGRLSKPLALSVATALFATGGIEGLWIYEGMTVFTVAWLWPALMQIGHSGVALTLFHETPSRQELLGSAIVLAGLVVAAAPVGAGR